MAYASPVVACTTSNVTISNPGFSSLDGVSLSVGSRLLLTGQSTPSQNGVWTWQGTHTALARPGAATTDQYKSGNVIDNATLIWVQAGSTYAGTCWGLDPAQVVTVDTTNHTLMKVALPPVQARLGSQTDVTISSPGTTIDGITANVGDVIALLAQTSGNGAADNGVYLFNGSASAMTRTSEPLVPNRIVRISEGNTLAHTEFALVTQGAVVVAQGSGNTALTFSRQFTKVNVKDFGARGDGSTNDATAIQNALNSIPSSGGALLFPPGTYVVTSSFTIPAAVQVMFEEGATLAPSSAAVTMLGRITCHPMQQVFGGTGYNGSVTPSQGGLPTVTATGSPTYNYTSVIVKIVVGGSLGTATFQYSLNGGASYSAIYPTMGSFPIPASGITVGFGAGTYVATTTYSWSAYQAITLGTLPFDEFNVKSWGAKGDGSTDDTNAIQAALDAANAAAQGLSVQGGMVNTSVNVFLPAGAYRVTAELALNN